MFISWIRKGPGSEFS